MTTRETTAAKASSMEKLRAVATTGLGILALVVVLLGECTLGIAQDKFRFVPQLQLTDLKPVAVSFAPDDGTLLLVLNKHGRIDVFDLSNPGRPVKITEIAAGAECAAFTPKGTPRDKIKIVSGGGDGIIRLWTLDGKPAAAPFKGHDVAVPSVLFSPGGTRITAAFSPDSTRIVSGSVDGTVRLWTLDGKPAADPFKGHEGAVQS